MSSSLDDPNDRLRTVAYAYFEHNQERGMSARLLKLSRRKTASSSARADARAGRVRRRSAVQKALTALVLRGIDLYRSAVIEALGDYHAAYARRADHGGGEAGRPAPGGRHPAMGKIGDKRALRCCRTAEDGARASASRPSPPRSACSASTADRTRRSSSRR
jgi:hypothetical protein